ncbi:uncharacterized protein LOC125649833 [Ostrea edulis]|uniref:uncharacterized protein LOC125649833 n=1 Tax=Ostrea edulis TaxID=37623 RepID=UPI0020942146|nr:uncharacterized protein LOC125649833 [Ostrea edulis]
MLLGSKDREAMLPIVMEREKESQSNLLYCLSCLSFWVSGWIPGLVAYVMAYQADRAKKHGDSVRYKLYTTVGMVAGTIGIISGLACIVLFFMFIFPVWYRHLYMDVEPDFPWE